MKVAGLEKAKRAVREAREILVAGHLNPDGDSIGSLLSLGMGLEKLGKRVYMVSCDGVPHKYRRLPGADRIIKNMTKLVDLAISVDCSSILATISVSTCNKVGPSGGVHGEPSS